MNRLPAATADTSADSWRRAGQRAEGYLAALDFDLAERRSIARAAVARAANDPAWTSKGPLAHTMIALQQALTERADDSLEVSPSLLADSSRVRLLRWLGGTDRAALQTGTGEHLRLAAMPPMQRTNMSPARIKRRPAPLRWLLQKLGAR
jgi:hypothetical protein